MPRQREKFLSYVGKSTDRRLVRRNFTTQRLVASDISWGVAGRTPALFSNMEAIMGTILLIILILLLIGALPTWPYSAGWGYYPSGGVGLVVIIIVILLLMGRI
jgi:hypothetical protein